MFSINSFPSKADRALPVPLSGRIDELADLLPFSRATLAALDQYFVPLGDEWTATRCQRTCATTYYKLLLDPITPNLQMEAEAIFYDLMALALETESSRVMSLFLDGLGQVFSIDGKALGAGYHGLSHHGNDPAMIQDLITIETAHMHCLSGFIKQLQEKKTVTGKSLLDDTIVLVGTGMGDASRHSNRDLPTLVFGGGFKHKGHLSFDHNSSSSPLLGDLYLSIMQVWPEVSEFSNANKNLNGHFARLAMGSFIVHFFSSSSLLPNPRKPYALIDDTVWIVMTDTQGGSQSN